MYVCTLFQQHAYNQNKMTETPTKTGAGSNKKSRKLWIIIAILLLVVLIGLLVFFLPKMNEYKELVQEKEAQRTVLQYELKKLMTSHDSIKTEYGTLADSLKVKDSIINANADEIKQLLNYKWEYHKVNKKLNLLRKITQGYVHQLDSVYTVNRELKEENEKIRQQYAKEQDKTRQLTRNNEELIEKVNVATELQAFNLVASTVRFTGSGRARDTDKANKVERVKVCFTLGENKLVESGLKPLYVRILRPDNVVVTQKAGGDYTFDYQDKTIEYTTRKEINYENKQTDICLNWDKKSEKESAMVGTYKVFIYAEDYLLGQTTFELR